MKEERPNPAKGTAEAPFGGPDRRDPTRRNQSGHFRREADRRGDARLSEDDIGAPDQGGLA